LVMTDCISKPSSGKSPVQVIVIQGSLVVDRITPVHGLQCESRERKGFRLITPLGKRANGSTPLIVVDHFRQPADLWSDYGKIKIKGDLGTLLRATRENRRVWLTT